MVHGNIQSNILRCITRQACAFHVTFVKVFQTHQHVYDKTQIQCTCAPCVKLRSMYGLVTTHRCWFTYTFTRFRAVMVRHISIFCVDIITYLPFVIHGVLTTNACYRLPCWWLCLLASVIDHFILISYSTARLYTEVRCNDLCVSGNQLEMCSPTFEIYLKFCRISRGYFHV